MENKKIIPIGDRILIRLDNQKEITNGGIILLRNNETDPPTTGTVVGLGTGLADKNFIVKEGDRVIFSKYAGSDVTIPDDNGIYKVMREGDLIGIINF
jgi:chaperonin GroES